MIGEAGEEEMVLPEARDLEIAFGQAFALEAAAGKQRDRRRIAGQASRLDPVQLQMVEGKPMAEPIAEVIRPCLVKGAPISPATPSGDAARTLKE
jgi:hypothetical protein